MYHETQKTPAAVRARLGRLARQAATFAALLFAPLAVATAATAPPQVIRVGTLYAGSGAFATISQPVYKGLKLWASEVNAHGGVYVKPYGKKIPVKVIAYNDQSSPSLATTLYDRLITHDHVQILTSDSGSVLTAPAATLAQEHKVLLFDQSGSSTKFFGPGNHYIVQLDDPITSLWSKHLAKYLEQVALKRGIRRVAIVYATNDFDGVQAQALETLLKHSAHAPKVVYYHGVPTGTSNYAVLIHRIQASHPDAVIEMGYPNNDISFLNDLHSSGIHFRMVFTIFPGLQPGLMQSNVGLGELDRVFTYAPPTVLNYKPTFGMGRKQFARAYHAKYGSQATVLWNSIVGYTTGLVIQKALAGTASMNSQALRKAVFSLSGKLVTLDGAFRLNRYGAQTGELMDIGQVHSKQGAATIVPVFPLNVAKSGTD